MAAYKARYDATLKATKEATETLISLADTPERKAANQTLKTILEEFVITHALARDGFR
jgi:hypothetical protein